MFVCGAYGMCYVCICVFVYSLCLYMSRRCGVVVVVAGGVVVVVAVGVAAGVDGANLLLMLVRCVFCCCA